MNEYFPSLYRLCIMLHESLAYKESDQSLVPLLRVISLPRIVHEAPQRLSPTRIALFLSRSQATVLRAARSFPFLFVSARVKEAVHVPRIKERVPLPVSALGGQAGQRRHPRGTQHTQGDWEVSRPSFGGILARLA